MTLEGKEIDQHMTKQQPVTNFYENFRFFSPPKSSAINLRNRNRSKEKSNDVISPSVATQTNMDTDTNSGSVHYFIFQQHVLSIRLS